MTIICDIDHTISDAAWRDPLLGNWDEYYIEAYLDKPITEVIDLVNYYGQFQAVVCLTARPERWRKLTLSWLVKHSVMFHDLLMRPDNNHEPSAILKPKMALTYFGDDIITKVDLVIDDREDVLSAFRALGLTTLQVTAGRNRHGKILLPDTTESELEPLS